MISQHLIVSTRFLAKELAWQLEHNNQRIVFAESCTAGLASAALAQIPGISKWLCGSAVTYQDTLKEDWLNVEPELIRKYSAVSPQVTKRMAVAVLNLVPAADFSIAITGHLQRTATADGPLAYVAAGFRRQNNILCSVPVCYRLNETSRVNRQWAAARAALNVAIEHLRFPISARKDQVDWQKICGVPTNFLWNHWK